MSEKLDNILKEDNVKQVINQMTCAKISLGKMRELINTNPAHPEAVNLQKVYDDMTKNGFGKEQIVYVNKNQLIAICDDLNYVVDKQVSNGVETIQTFAMPKTDKMTPSNPPQDTTEQKIVKGGAK